MYELRIAGAPGHAQRKASWSWLADQALLLADRGYTAVLIDGANPSRGIEVRRNDDGLQVQRFHNGTNPANDPGWIDSAEAWITDHLKRRAL